MAENPTLHGKYVDLRPLCVEDAQLTFGWRGGGRGRLLNRGAPSIEAQAEWIRTRPGNERNFIIQLKDGRPVGMLALVGIDLVSLHAEVGRFLIGEEEAVRGVPAAVEAMKLLYRLAFNELGLVRLFGTIASDNLRMVKWQKYLGMRQEGRMRSHYFIDGKFQDALVFGLLREEYLHDALPKLDALIALTAAAGACGDRGK